MSREEEVWVRIEKELSRIYAPHATAQVVAMIILGAFAIACFYKAFHL
jgi:hypothetical protein